MANLNERTGDLLARTLTAKDIMAIEKALNVSGATEVTVKVEQGRVVVLAIQKKKIM